MLKYFSDVRKGQINMDYPVLSICLITYNHSKYIRQAIEGVLMQKVNFTWELIIADDFSIDGTRDILREYASAYPGHVRLILQEKNVGALQNWLDLITVPKSKYIAYFEGDDYWTDPLKLQTQVDFLEQHDEYVACYHDVSVVDSENTLIRKSKSSSIHMRDLTADELMKGRVMSALSLCFRNVIKEFPPEVYQIPLGDKFLCSMLGQYGHGKYLSGIKPSAYRMHGGGIWSQQSTIRKEMNLIKTYFWMWQYYQRIDRKEYAMHYYNMIIRHGFFSGPQSKENATWFDNFEYAIVKMLRKMFVLLRRWLRVPSSK